jgi:hypothetical protein
MSVAPFQILAEFSTQMPTRSIIKATFTLACWLTPTTKQQSYPVTELPSLHHTNNAYIYMDAFIFSSSGNRLHAYACMGLWPFGQSRKPLFTSHLATNLYIIRILTKVFANLVQRNMPMFETYVKFGCCYIPGAWELDFFQAMHLSPWTWRWGRRPRERRGMPRAHGRLKSYSVSDTWFIGSVFIYFYVYYNSNIRNLKLEYYSSKPKIFFLLRRNIVFWTSNIVFAQ